MILALDDEVPAGGRRGDPARTRRSSSSGRSGSGRALSRLSEPATRRPPPGGPRGELVLLRHGESTSIVEGRFQGRLETPLSPLGERQAALAGGRGSPGPPTRRGPGPGPAAGRDRPFAARARRGHRGRGRGRARRGPRRGRPRRCARARALEIGQGDWEGLHRDEVEARYPAELAAWRRPAGRANAPGGESLRAARRRVRDALEDVVGRPGRGRAGRGPDRTSVGGYPAGPAATRRGRSSSPTTGSSRSPC